MEVNTYNIPGVCIAFRTLINVTNLGLCLIHLTLTLQHKIAVHQYSHYSELFLSGDNVKIKLLQCLNIEIDLV